MRMKKGRGFWMHKIELEVIKGEYPNIRKELVEFDEEELTKDWFSMTNDMFFEKHGLNWSPSNRQKKEYWRGQEVKRNAKKQLYGQ